jgi:hypothetical protein
MAPATTAAIPSSMFQKIVKYSSLRPRSAKVRRSAVCVSDITKGYYAPWRFRLRFFDWILSREQLDS